MTENSKNYSLKIMIYESVRKCKLGYPNYIILCYIILYYIIYLLYCRKTQTGGLSWGHGISGGIEKKACGNSRG